MTVFKYVRENNVTDGKERKILSQHEDKTEALEAGKKAWQKAPKGTTICCINGTLDENRNIKGQYRLYEVWT